MENEATITLLDGIPTVTSLEAFENAVEAFARDGGRQKYMSSLLALRLRADAIRYLAAYPGRTMCVREMLLPAESSSEPPTYGVGAEIEVTALELRRKTAESSQGIHPLKQER